MSSQTPTQWAVICPRHGQVFLTEDEYNAQMCDGDSKWKCTRFTYQPGDAVGPCGAFSEWDDANYDDWEERAR